VIVLTGHTAGVERPHGQLRAGLPDRLGGDDADQASPTSTSLPVANGTAVADRTAAERRLAGQHAPHPDRGDPARDQLVDDDVAEVGAAGNDGVALGVGRVFGEERA